MLPDQDAVANNQHCQNRRCSFLILSYMLRNISAEAQTKERRSVLHHCADRACLSGALRFQSIYLGEIVLIDLRGPPFYHLCEAT